MIVSAIDMYPSSYVETQIEDAEGRGRTQGSLTWKGLLGDFRS